jgi:hypothetical protein
MSVDDTVGSSPASAGATEGVEQGTDIISNILWTGTYRVYEGRESSWVIDGGVDTKQHPIDEVYIYTAAFSKVDRSRQWPIAWLEGFGTVLVAEGVAVVEDRKPSIVEPD